MSDIERELEAELRRLLDPLAEQPIPALRVEARGRAMRTAVGGAGAAVALKLLTGVAAAAAVLTVAGVATTGSFNPVDWGQQVSQRVSACRHDLTAGQHGIGDCVSDFASGHGAAVASAARQHGQGNGNGNGSANAHGNNPNADQHAKDKSKSHPVPAPKGNSAGDPTDPSTHAAVTPPPPHP